MKKDSKVEEWFEWWLEEAKRENIIYDYKRAKTYDLFNKVQLGNIILREHSYTPDFEIIFDQFNNSGKLFNLFDIHKHTDNVIIEIKPDFEDSRTRSMKRVFGINQKWMYQVHNIYVHQVELPSFFIKTFTPEKFLFTPTGREKKLKYKPRTIDDFIKTS